MDGKDITREKLHLLYILREAPGLQGSELIETALGTLTADYFMLAEALNWLESSELIVLMDTDLMTDSADARNGAECYLTAQGERVLLALEDQIAESVRRWVSEHLAETSVERRKRKAIEADYKLTDKGSFLLRVQHLSEQGDSFNIELELPSEELARKAAFNFRRDPEKFYTVMIKTLLEED